MHKLFSHAEVIRYLTQHHCEVFAQNSDQQDAIAGDLDARIALAILVCVGL
jgi:hypothetical protein